jgi:hypothetical protein
MLTVIASYLYLLLTSGHAAIWLSLLSFIHFFLHLFYIIHWNDKQNNVIISIREWSAENKHCKRVKKNGIGMFIYNTLGTLFDIYVHLYMLMQLFVEILQSLSFF